MLRSASDEMAAQLGEILGDIDPGSAKGRKRLAILKAAKEAFTRDGYRNTSMDAIAEAVGVAKGTLYLYYPRKADLMIACVALEKSEWIPRMRAIFEADVPAATKLKRWIVAVLMLPQESPLLCNLMQATEDLSEIYAAIPREMITQGMERFAQLMSELLEEIAGPEHRWSSIELRDRAAVLGGLGHLAPIIRNEWAHRGIGSERFAILLADLVVDGLRPREKQS